VEAEGVVDGLHMRLTRADMDTLVESQFACRQAVTSAYREQAMELRDPVFVSYICDVISAMNVAFRH